MNWDSKTYLTNNPIIGVSLWCKSCSMRGTVIDLRFIIGTYIAFVVYQCSQAIQIKIESGGSCYFSGALWCLPLQPVINFRLCRVSIKVFIATVQMIMIAESEKRNRKNVFFRWLINWRGKNCDSCIFFCFHFFSQFVFVFAQMIYSISLLYLWSYFFFWVLYLYIIYIRYIYILYYIL